MISRNAALPATAPPAGTLVSDAEDEGSVSAPLPWKKAIPRSLGSTISQKPCSKRTPTDSEYDIG